MQRDVFSIRKILFPFLLVTILVGMFIRTQNDAQGIPEAIWGTPVRFENNTPMPYSGIEQVVADSEHLYILYSSNRGVIQVYNLDGVYLYSWRLYKHTNGAFHMAVQNDVLYIRDYKTDIYVFSNGEFIEFLHGEAASTVKKSIPFSQFEENTTGYVVKNGSVWYITNGISRCVVSRPLISSIFQNNLHIVLFILILSSFGFMRYLKNK